MASSPSTMQPAEISRAREIPTRSATAPQSALPPEVESVLEIVIDGLSEQDVAASMQAGITAVCGLGAAAGVVAVDAGNYGGNLGPFHFKLRQLMAPVAGETVV